MKGTGALFKLLSDEARLRLLRLLAVHDLRLNVTELTAILGLAQSGVSRHLGLLKDAGLVLEERWGGFTYYKVSPEAQNGRFPGLWPHLEAQFNAAGADPAVRADEARLQEVLRLRKENFETHGTGQHQMVPGRSWAAWSRALGLLLPPLTVADLGCGEGYLTLEAARWAKRVVAIDRSNQVLARARSLASRRGVKNVVWKRGEIERLPLEDATIDVALLSQALHHAADPPLAVREAARVLRPGGRLLVLDLRAHDQGWVREELGDRWPGFADEELARMLKGAGLQDVVVRVGARLTGDPFTVLIACGTKNDSTRRNAKEAKDAENIR
jgi:ArsR family transcriptional regulator